GAGVGQERERQVFVGGEGPDRLGVIGGDADHVEAGGGQRRQVVAEVAGLGRAAGGGGLRVEVDDDLPAGEVRLRVGPAVGIGQGEVRCGVSDGQFSGHDGSFRLLNI